MGRKPRGASGEAWGILNPYGDVWTPDTFRTAEQAKAHLVSFWKGVTPASVTELDKFKVVRVKVHVTYRAPKAP